MTDDVRKVKHVYKTTDDNFKPLQLYKIHADKKTYDESLDEIISLGWQKYKELEDEKLQNGRKEKQLL